MKLILGDCLELMKEIPDRSIDMVLADPPYGTTACKWDTVIDLAPMWEQLKRVIKPSGAIVMTASQPFTSALVMSNPKMFKYCWVWEKSKATGHLQANMRPLVAHEDVCVFYVKQPTYIPQKTQGAPYKASRREVNKKGVYGIVGAERAGNESGLYFPRSVQKHSRPHKTSHPTQKPVALIEYLIRTYTNEGESVLDFTMGSGTTGMACANTGRRFIGIELDQGYFDIAQQRIQETTDKK